VCAGAGRCCMAACWRCALAQAAVARCFSFARSADAHCRAPRPHARPLPPVAFLSFVRSPSLPTPLLAPTALRQRTSYPFRCAAACVRVFARPPPLGGKLTLRGAQGRKSALRLGMRVALELLPADDAGQSRQRHVKAWRLSSGGAETGGAAASARREEVEGAASEGRRRAEARGPRDRRAEEGGGGGRQCAAVSPMPAVQDMSQILQERHILSGLFALAGAQACMHHTGAPVPCTRAHARMHACAYVRTRLNGVSLSLSLSLSLYAVYIHVSVYMLICKCICICMYIYMYIYIQTDSARYTTTSIYLYVCVYVYTSLSLHI
jgi:hypothetical protein